MKEYGSDDLYNALKNIGVKKDDLIFINPEIYRFGFFNNTKNSRNLYEEFFYTINELIGKNGTLCVNTYTFDTLKYNKKFLYESSKCTSGGFSEFILKQKKVIRSNHPVFSVSAIGKYAKKICNNNSSHNFGYNSPYQKFHSLNGKVLNLGMDPWKNPYNHIAEYMIGVPYCYNKLTKVKYFKKNKLKDYKFSSFVRYLDFNLIWDYKKLKNKLSKTRLVKKTKLGGGFIYSVNAQNYLNLCLKMLTIDQFALIKKNYYLKKIKKNIFENLS